MKYQVWSEGYRATGEYATAEFLGIYEANSFLEACQKAVNNHSDYINYYDSKTNSIWGCKLFDNEKDARKNFG